VTDSSAAAGGAPTGSSAAGAVAPRLATAAELDDWDARTVHVPGGHVYQSRTWAMQRERLGWQPLHVMVDADHPALVLVRSVPLIGGASAYIPRGPVADPAAAGPAAAARVAALTTFLAGRGIDVVATDAEVPAEDAAYAAGLRDAGFHPIPEIQPSRHRISLDLPVGTDEDAARSGLTKSTRQRVAAAERDGILVRRWDVAGWDGDAPLFDRTPEPPDVALGGFATLLEGTGQRRGFRFGPREVFIDWWRAGHAAGLVVFLEARDPADPARSLGGLLLYRHGDRLSTVHSADAPGVRDTHPGVMHLLRWRAIQLAIREGRREMDLGGVDVGPDHAEPGQGDPMAGLYEHKRSFGARWVAMTGAHERVIRPRRYAVGRVATRVARVIGRVLPGGRPS
jgi:lipid II:glycine glycyltransferase (peptidoglycan interpeptide bridge formation enzyme)